MSSTSGTPFTRSSTWRSVASALPLGAAVLLGVVLPARFARAQAIATPAPALAPAAVGAQIPVAPISGAALGAAAPTAAPTSAPAAQGEASATDSPRERGRVLQKRNPIASEYLVPGTLGRSPGALSDGEGNDYRGLFPRTGALIAAADQTLLGAFYTYQSLSGRGEPGADVQLRRRFGATERTWVVELRANVTSASRLIEHYEAAWAPLVVLDADGRRPRGAQTPQLYNGQDVYFLDRPRISQDDISTRTRNLVAHVEHRLSPQHTVFAQATVSDYYDDYFRNRIELNNGSGAAQPGFGTAPQGGTTVLAGDYRDAGTRRFFARTLTSRDILRLQAGGRFKTPDLRIDYSAYASRWVSKSLSDGWNFTERGVDLRYRIDSTDAAFPRLSVTNGIDLNDTTRSTFNDLRASHGETTDTDGAGRIDLERRLALAGGTAWISAGALHRQKERDSTSDKSVYLRTAAASLPLSRLILPGRAGLVVENFYDLPPGLDTAAAHALYLAGHPALAYSTSRSTLETLQDLYTSKEAVTGGYVSGIWVRGPWEIEAGARREHTRTNTLGTVIAPAATDTGTGRKLAEVTDAGVLYSVRESPGTNGYNTLLPSVSVARKLSAEWTVRASFYEQLMRPQYFDIVNYRRVAPPTATIGEGNPTLRPTSIRTFVVAADYRAPWLGELSAELYRTSVRDFFYGAVNFEIVDGDLYSVSRVENGDRGTLQGFQLQWTRPFKPGALQLTLSPALAYTYSDSEATVPTRPLDTLTLPERSRHLLRAELGWDAAGVVGGSVSLGMQSQALDDVGPSSGRDGYRDDVFSLDAGLWWKVTKRLRTTLSATNLTDAPERSFEGNALRTTRTQYSSTTLRLGGELRF